MTISKPDESARPDTRGSAVIPGPRHSDDLGPWSLIGSPVVGEHPAVIGRLPVGRGRRIRRSSEPGRGAPPPGWGSLARLGLHLTLAGAPLLAISAQVFDLMDMSTVLAWLIVPGVIVAAALALFSPHPMDRVLVSGLGWGIVACLLYDLFRLDTVYLLGWWGDFIPAMGTWITGGRPGGWDGAVVGYLWRYIGDGGGIGVTFFAVAAAVGLRERRRHDVVVAAVAFAVFPVWAGLIATVALAPRGQQMLFGLTPTTLTLSLVGHLIFGAVLGLGLWTSRDVVAGWPWPVLRPAGRRALRPGGHAHRAAQALAGR